MFPSEGPIDPGQVFLHVWEMTEKCQGKTHVHEVFERGDDNSG